MKTDGTEYKVEKDKKSGAMGTYGTGGSSVLYFSEGRKRYLKDHTLYFSEGTSIPNLSRQTPPGTGPVETLSNKKADNFVFAPEAIYFRLEEKSDGSDYYGIRRANYDVTPQGTGKDARLNDTDSVRSQLSRFNPANNSGINIIGDDLYWMTDNKNAQQYKPRRVVKEMPY